MDKIQLLSSKDMYDVYGCQDLLCKEISTFEKAKVTARLQDIRKLYLTSVKSRVRACAKTFFHIDIDDDNWNRMLDRARESITKNLQKSFQTGAPINLMAEIMKSHQQAGLDISDINVKGLQIQKTEKIKGVEVDPKWFDKKNVSWAELWVEISKAYLGIEEAFDPMQICVKIDALNQLQHCRSHVLIDLQIGRMIENSEGENQNNETAARANLQGILDMAKNSREPVDFAHEMSEDIKPLVLKHRNTKLIRKSIFEK